MVGEDPRPHRVSVGLGVFSEPDTGPAETESSTGETRRQKSPIQHKRKDPTCDEPVLHNTNNMCRSKSNDYTINLKHEGTSIEYTCSKKQHGDNVPNP